MVYKYNLIYRTQIDLSEQKAPYSKIGLIVGNKGGFHLARYGARSAFVAFLLIVNFVDIGSALILSFSRYPD